jgi:hypothetical protein
MFFVYPIAGIVSIVTFVYLMIKLGKFTSLVSKKGIPYISKYFDVFAPDEYYGRQTQNIEYFGSAVGFLLLTTIIFFFTSVIGYGILCAFGLINCGCGC